MYPTWIEVGVGEIERGRCHMFPVDSGGIAFRELLSGAGR